LAGIFAFSAPKLAAKSFLRVLKNDHFMFGLPEQTGGCAWGCFLVLKGLVGHQLCCLAMPECQFAKGIFVN
jgi:hypothetical protein